MFWQEFMDRLRVFAAAIGVHVLMAALVVLGTMNWQPFRQEKPVAISIEAVIIDTSEIKRQRDEARRAQELEERRRQRAAELERQREREAEDQRRREEEAARREREMEEQRKREAADRLQQLRLERERKMEDERLRQQRELEQIREQREAAERQRRLEEERLKQLETQRERKLEDERQKQLEAQRQREADEQARAFRAGQMADLQTQYIATIAAVVTDNWLRPPTARAGLECIVRVVQIPGGEVISSSLAGRCNGDEATRRSILAAVDRTGVLPYRGFEDVFQREIEFRFTYSGE
ncbi:MAG: cell envelope integrity protein TolA [Xanthomonadales bacterium]|nr:cell envelope integrity protein TolA [Xanthomonadales bacterium]